MTASFGRRPFFGRRSYIVQVLKGGLREAPGKWDTLIRLKFA